MTVSTTTSSQVFLGNGTASVFTCAFRIFQDSDVTASLFNIASFIVTPLVLNTDFTVTGEGAQNGFTLTTTVAPPTGTKLIVVRNIPYTQPTDFTNQGSFFPTMHEDMADRLEMQIQQVEGQAGGSLQLSLAGPYYDLGSNTLINSGTAVNANDVPNFLQVQGMIVGGAVPALGGINGSALVGFTAGGTGAVLQNLQAKIRERVTLEDYGAVGDGITDDYPAYLKAYAYLVLLGGGKIECAAKVYAFGTQITITHSNISLVGKGADGLHNGGTNAAIPATRFKWIGASGGTQIWIGTPAVTTNQVIGRCRLEAICLDGNQLAAYGLYINSLRNSSFIDLYATNQTVTCYYGTSNTSVGYGDPQDTQRNTFERCTYRVVDTAAVQNAHGFVLTSVNPFVATANASFNNFISCTGLTYNGDGFRLIDCDNNYFIKCSSQATGSGGSLRFLGAYGNVFMGWSGNTIYYQGTASGAVVNSAQNSFFGVDESNGTSYPIGDVGCTLQWHGNRYGFQGLLAGQASIAQTSSAATVQLANIGSNSLIVTNGSNAGILQTDGTHQFSWSIDSSGFYRCTSNVVGATMDFTQGAQPVSVKFGKVGFNGVAPVGTYAATGGALGFTAGTLGGTVLAQSTFTGLIGSSAHTIGDAIAALKRIGVLAM